MREIANSLDGPIKIGICSHRNILEACMFEFKEHRDCTIHEAEQFQPEDQWSCKRSPEICCIYQYTCLNIMVFNPSTGADEALVPFSFSE